MQQQKACRRTSQVERAIRRIGKKHRNVDADIPALERLLQAERKENLQAARVQGFSALEVWKGRAINRDIQRGKSAGYRVWWLETDDEFVLIYVYTHQDEGDEQGIRQEVGGRLSANGY